MSNETRKRVLQIITQNEIFLKVIFQRKLETIRDSGATFYVNLGLQLNTIQNTFGVTRQESYGKELNHVRDIFIHNLRPGLENLRYFEKIKQAHMVAFQHLLVQLELSKMTMFESVFFQSLKSRVDQSKSNIDVLVEMVNSIQENMENVETILKNWCKEEANEEKLLQMQQETMNLNLNSWQQTQTLEDWFHKELEADEPSVPSPEKLATYFLTLLRLCDLKKCLQDIHKLRMLLIRLNISRIFTEKLINKH